MTITNTTEITNIPETPFTIAAMKLADAMSRAHTTYASTTRASDRILLDHGPDLSKSVKNVLRLEREQQWLAYERARTALLEHLRTSVARSTAVRENQQHEQRSFA